MAEVFENLWGIDLQNPIQGRNEKPRNNGLTMVIDKGIGINGLNDLMDLSSKYIDFHKFSFGTSLLYPLDILKEKIKLVKNNGIDVYPGSTLFEIAFTQNKIEKYFFKLKELGF